MQELSRRPSDFQQALLSVGCWKGALPKYKRLLSDPDIKKWYDNVCRGSKITADVYLRRLGAICSTSGARSTRLTVVSLLMGWVLIRPKS